MKSIKLLLFAFALIVTIGACQNRSSDTADSDSPMTDKSSMSMSNMDSTKNNKMMSATNGMMDAMHQMTMTGNVDVDFAMMMKGHHQGAVDMAEIELKSGEDATLKQMAQNIIDAQKAEIKELDALIDSRKNPVKNYDPTKKGEGFAKVMEGSMKGMMDMPKMDEHMSSSTDRQFVSMMIMHHKSAVDMAKGYLQSGKDAKMIIMAKKMITDQTQEIEEFKIWKENHQ